MVFENIVVFLFITTFGIINVGVQCKREQLYIRGQIKCYDRHPTKIHVGIYQKTFLKRYYLLSEMSCRCGEYFAINATESRISARNKYFTTGNFSRPMPIVVLTYDYTYVNIICKVRAKVYLPKECKDGKHFGKIYQLNAVDISNVAYEEMDCHRIRRRSTIRKKSSYSIDRSRFSTRF
uniref:ZP domain-containing protein n=1 Tax=Strongyloides papillosus TaxID=174720 RepID=A0A0N5C9J9_STREA